MTIAPSDGSLVRRGRRAVATQLHVHGVAPVALAGLALAWLFVVVASRIGIPRVEPGVTAIRRPLETLGTVALILPPCVQASLLADRAPWLTATSPRRRWLLRLLWLAEVTGVGAIAAALWTLWGLPDGVPAGHVMSLWGLMVAGATMSAVAFRHDLALVIPIGIVVLFTIPGVVPFGANIVYNVALTHQLTVDAIVSCALAASAYALLGDGASRSRPE